MVAGRRVLEACVFASSASACSSRPFASAKSVEIATTSVWRINRFASTDIKSFSFMKSVRRATKVLSFSSNSPASSVKNFVAPGVRETCIWFSTNALVVLATIACAMPGDAALPLIVTTADSGGEKNLTDFSSSRTAFSLSLIRSCMPDPTSTLRTTVRADFTLALHHFFSALSSRSA